MPIFRRGPEPHALALAMTGIQLGDQLLQIGCHDRTLVAALAGRVGLSGRACVVGYDAEQAERARMTAAKAGVFVEIEQTRGALSYPDATFDLAVIDGTGGLIADMRPEDRVRCLQETMRVLRGAGRVILIETGARGGLGGLFRHRGADSHYLAHGGAETALKAEGFRSVRLLAERDGLKFYEGTKARN